MENAPTRGRCGVLLVNLGTPTEPTPRAVARYLAEFLADPRVVEIPRLIWLPLLFGLILPLRCKRVARNYASIWTERGSPLRVYTDDLAAALNDAGPWPVRSAYRYGEPSLACGLAELQALGCEHIAILPTYPQYSATTTATILDKLAQIFGSQRRVPGISFIDTWATLPGYIEALAQSVRAHWEAQGRGEKLLLSFHGLPQRNVSLGDPYQEQCEATATALAQALGLAEDEWQLCYQSRFGKAEWLQPYTYATLEQLAHDGCKRVDVICPGFVADCLETLEEIAIGGEEVFRQAGGNSLHYIPALNASPALATAMRQLLDDYLPTTV